MELDYRVVSLTRLQVLFCNKFDGEHFFCGGSDIIKNNYLKKREKILTISDCFVPSSTVRDRMR